MITPLRLSGPVVYTVIIKWCSLACSDQQISHRFGKLEREINLRGDTGFLTAGVGEKALINIL